MLSVRTVLASLLLAAVSLSAAPTATAAGHVPVQGALLRHDAAARPLRISTSFDGATVRRLGKRRVTVQGWGNVEGACTERARSTAAAMARAAARDLLSELQVTRTRSRGAKVVFRDAFDGPSGLELRCEARIEMTAARAGRRRVARSVR